MSSKARQNRTVGEIVNLMSIDAQRLLDLVTYLYGIYSTILKIIVALVLLYRILGPSVFAGFGAMVLLVPLNLVATERGKKYQVCCVYIAMWLIVAATHRILIMAFVRSKTASDQ